MSERKETKNYEFYNPKDTRDILFQEIEKSGIYRFNKKRNKEERQDWKYTSSDFIKNPALMFGKLIPYSFGKDEKENKHKYLELVINEMNKLNNEIKDRGFDFLNRYEFVMNKLTQSGYQLENFISSLSFRMVIGLGACHPQETSMTLHHIYGIPYIPGSAVKGVTRHWVIASQFDNDEKKAEKDDDFKDIFGTQAQAGKIIFFDAYPVDGINLKIDVMTPHYPDYYSKGVEPADWQSPNPIKFLTVQKTKFSFWLAGREKALEELVEKAKEWLTDALKKYGIGAKTSIGYGYFE